MYRLVTFALAMLAATGPAGAAELVIGRGWSMTNAPFSFTNNANPTSFQQVYLGSALGAGPVSISRLTFHLATPSGRGSQVSGGTYTLGLSTTTRAVGALDATDFASNIGADNKQIYSGALAPRFQQSKRLLTFEFAPFTFDPAKGNLLLDMSIAGFTIGRNSFWSVDMDDVSSSVDNFGYPTSRTLKTTFEVSPAAVPEPATWAMMIAGFGFVGASLRRRRQVNQPALAQRLP